MSRGDKNIDQLFKSAFSGQKHEMDPAFWMEAQQMMHAPKAAPKPWFTKPIYIALATVSIGITSLLFFESTPKNSTNQLVSSSTSPSSPMIESITDKTSPLKKNETQNSSNSKESPVNAEQKPSESLQTIPQITNSTSLMSDSEEKELNSTNERSNQTSKNTITSNTISNKNLKKASLNFNPPRSTSNRKAERGSFAYSPTQLIMESSLKEDEEAFDYQLTQMETSNWKNLEVEFGMVSGPSEQSNSHKPLLKPINIRFSAGGMMDLQQNSNSPIIKNNFTEKHVELTGEYLFQKRWGIQTGLRYAEISNSQNYNLKNIEDLSYWNEEQIITTSQNRVWWLGGWYYYPPTTDTTISKTWINQFDTSISNVSVTHKIQYIDIPVLITYNYGINRFNLQLSAGANFGFPINASGQILSSKDPFPTDILDSEFVNKFQTSLLFQTEVAYGLNDKWWISIRPQLKYELNSIYNATSSTSPQVIYFGLNTGLTYKF